MPARNTPHYEHFQARVSLETSETLGLEEGNTMRRSDQQPSLGIGEEIGLDIPIELFDLAISTLNSIATVRLYQPEGTSTSRENKY